MGALDYALAGAVKGGADTFLEISKEERGEEREIKKEKRLNSFQEIRDKRLAEINAEAAEKDRDFRSEESATDREFRSGESAADRTSRETTARERLELDQSKPINVTTPDGSITKQYNTKTKTWDVITDNPDDATGLDTQKRYDKMDKEFQKNTQAYFGQLDKSGLLVSFNSDEKASMAARAASIASQTFRKYDGRIDPNTIWTKVFETIKSGKVQLDAELEALDAEIEAIQEEAWYKFD